MIYKTPRVHQPRGLTVYRMIAPISAAHRGSSMEPMPLAGSPPGTSLTWRLTDQLGTAIVGGTFSPGEVLPNEVDIGTTYQVGRSAVREAVKVLAAKGLVDSRPGRGTAVRPVTTWNLLDPDILRWL